MKRYIKVSPRGFANETFIACGTPAEVEIALSVINDDCNAWAVRVPAGHVDVRAAKRAYDRCTSQGEREYWAIPNITENMLSEYRPTYLHEDGSRSLGGPRLPEAANA